MSDVSPSDSPAELLKTEHVEEQTTYTFVS